MYLKMVSPEREWTIEKQKKGFLKGKKMIGKKKEMCRCFSFGDDDFSFNIT